MKITLLIDEKEKIFSVPFIKARNVKRVFEISDTLSNFSPESGEKLAEFIVNIFNNQFTIDDVLDGMSIQGLLDESIKLIEEIMNSFEIKVKN